MIKTKPGFLVLESGEVFEGLLFSENLMPKLGEVVFNTSHAGYQEIASDPSYFRQIVVMSAPMQGNYGYRFGDDESKKYWIEGFICLEIQSSRRDHSWIDSLAKQNIPILTGLDTRQLILRTRDLGASLGVICQANSSAEALQIAGPIFKNKDTLRGDWTLHTSRSEVEHKEGKIKNGPRVAVLDFGVKENILRSLVERTSELAIFPSSTKSQLIREWEPDGILLSNGPGDPIEVTQGIQTVKELLGAKPVFGICMGHQVLSLALGGKTFKMKFGHRGGNHPVRDMLLDQIYMTSQNHGYAVDASTLPEGTQITHLNLNDQTVEGFELKSKQAFSVQYHPESSPGPQEAEALFDLFVDRLK